jgi:hypothetical protein
MLRTSVVVIVVLASFACGSAAPSAPSDNSTPPGASGTPPGSSGAPSNAGILNLRITDNPFDSARAVLITFSEVSVLRGTTWTRVPFRDGAPTWTCDLKKLENRTEDLLATGIMPLGEYTWVRLVLQSATVYTDNVAVTPTPCAQSIPAPAGGSHVMTLATSEGRENGSFPVTAGVTTTVLIDFDGEASITQRGPGDLVMNPVLRLLSVR